MFRLGSLTRYGFACSIIFVVSGFALAQRASNASTDEEPSFGPVMQAYLGYLSNEREVVDDRNSRREISAAYYRRNSNRIRALRQMAIRLVRQSGNDYVPELEAVTVDEFRTLFEKPPNPAGFRTNEILANKFRFLGVAHAGEVFYVFARLDPYEQAELMQRRSVQLAGPGTQENVAAGAKGQRTSQATTRPRRIVPR